VFKFHVYLPLLALSELDKFTNEITAAITVCVGVELFWYIRTFIHNTRVTLFRYQYELTILKKKRFIFRI